MVLRVSPNDPKEYEAMGKRMARKVYGSTTPTQSKIDYGLY
jgi:hypothetical protein